MKAAFLKMMLTAAGCAAVLSSCSTEGGPTAVAPRGSDGPATTASPPAHQRGNAATGRDVFRFETFGNEGFWTDAARLPKGMMDAKFTPKQALEAGLQVDIDAVDPALRKKMEAELRTDMSPQNAPMLNDPKTTVALINANAVVGMVPKDSNGDGKLDVTNGDKVGVACTICHTITDKSVFDMPNGGSIGRRVDGPAALTLNVGKLLAMAANSRAFYPNLQQSFLGISLGRAPSGLGPESTEAEVDAYLGNPAYYPVGTFDETQDGHAPTSGAARHASLADWLYGNGFFFEENDYGIDQEAKPGAIGHARPGGTCGGNVHTGHDFDIKFDGVRRGTRPSARSA